jgi:S1-C subfamily serine protease
VPTEIIVTVAHVVGQSREVQVVFADGERARGRVRATDDIVDLAVVEVDRPDLPVVPRRTALPAVGELAIALGSPLGFQESVTAGIVSGLHRSLVGSGGPGLVDLLQTDAPISPGNSGGALVDGSGRLIGINEAYIPPAAGAVAIGFAIPTATVVDDVDELLTTGRASHAFLGVQPGELTPELAERLGSDWSSGVLVLDVVAGSPAAESGLRPGDIITGLDQRPVRTVDDLLAALRELDPGHVIDLRVLREGRTMTIRITIADRPSG